jgi:hypothetical protein
MTFALNKAGPSKIFLSYAHEDEYLKQQLENHLRLLRHQDVAVTWDDRLIEAGGNWEDEIDENLNTADIILLLISEAFMASDYAYQIEMKRALERHEAKHAQVVPIILRPYDWKSAPFGKLQVLPKDGKAVTLWQDRDEAFTNIAEGIRNLINKSRVAVKPQVSDLLPYLCDRSDQKTGLKEGVREWKKASRPFVCIIHGNDDECHYRFKERLQQVLLPALLRRRTQQGSIQDFKLDLPTEYVSAPRPFDFLSSELGQAVAEDMEAPRKTIINAISDHKTPLLFHSYLGSQDWEPHGPKFVEAFLRFWNAIPSVPEFRIIACLFIKYRTTGEQNDLRFTEIKRRTQKYLEELKQTFLTYPKIHAIVLPELEGIRQQEAENWVANKDYFRGLCRRHPHEFCNVESATASIRSIYDRPEFMKYNGYIPMERLAKELVTVIRENSC